MINFSDAENRGKLLDLDKNSLNATLFIQKNLNKQILSFMKNYIGNIQINFDLYSDSADFHYINDSFSMLSKSNDNIASIKALLSTINELSVDIKNNDFSESFFKKADNYNETFNNTINTVYENTNSIESFIRDISLIDISELLKQFSSTANIQQEVSNENIDLQNSPSISSELFNSCYIENTLVISDIQGIVILPYTLEKIRNILSSSGGKYNSLSEVIEKLYTKPTKSYRFAAFSRFREAYNLMINKEHSSKFKALCLATELFSNYNLHPAIITACESLDQLDIYLSCLEDNTLDEFKYFDIKYEIAPVIVTE